MNLLLLTLLFAGRKDDQIIELQQQVMELQTQLIECEKEKASCEQANAGPKPVAPGDEEKATELYGQATEFVENFQAEEAKAVLTVLLAEYGETRTAARARRMLTELEVVGRDAPALSPSIESWFVGSADYSPTGYTVLVFWEVWCPHCKREMPQMNEWTREMRESGEITVIGLTKITKSSTPEKVTEFLTENAIDMPIAKENGALSTAFNVSGIPAAAVVKDGKIVWRGHPARLNAESLRR